MIQNIASQINTQVSNFSLISSNSFENAEVSCQDPKLSDMRLQKLLWDIMFDIHTHNLKFKRDYAYTARQISDRYKSKGKKGCCVRNIEMAFSILQTELKFVRKTTRKYPVQFGKEKYRGSYRELTEEGLAFFQSKFERRKQVKLDIQRKLENAELNAELIVYQPYCHVASEPISISNLKKDRSNPDHTLYLKGRSGMDFANACFEEYAASLNSALEPSEIDLNAEEGQIEDEVLPKYQVTVKKLLEGSQLDLEGKKQVIGIIVKQQSTTNGIISITGFTKKIIENVMKKREQEDLKRPFHKIFVPTEAYNDLTCEQKEKANKVKDDLLRQMRKSLLAH